MYRKCIERECKKKVVVKSRGVRSTVWSKRAGMPHKYTHIGWYLNISTHMSSYLIRYGALPDRVSTDICWYQNRPIQTRKYHRGASVPKQIWPLSGTKYHCQRTKNRDFQQLTRVQWKNVNHIAGGVVQVQCRNSYNAKYARRATSNQLCVA